MKLEAGLPPDEAVLLNEKPVVSNYKSVIIMESNLLDLLLPRLSFRSKAEVEINMPTLMTLWTSNLIIFAPDFAF